MVIAMTTWTLLNIHGIFLNFRKSISVSSHSIPAHLWHYRFDIFVNLFSYQINSLMEQNGITSNYLIHFLQRCLYRILIQIYFMTYEILTWLLVMSTKRFLGAD